MNSETEREACPFCGSGHDRVGPRKLFGHITIQCGDCESSGPWIKGEDLRAATIAWNTRAAQPAEAGEALTETVTKALRRAWQLGQTYWQQADSESYVQNKRSDNNQAMFNALVDETRAALKGDSQGGEKA